MKAMRVLLLVVGLTLTGCTALGFTTPQSTDQRIAYAYAGVTASLQTIAQATSAGTLSSTKASQANNMVLQVKSLLDAAKAAEATSDNEALQDLNMATAALTAVQQYLQANGVK
jgi:hypothetical protein